MSEDVSQREPDEPYRPRSASARRQVERVVDDTLEGHYVDGQPVQPPRPEDYPPRGEELPNP